jgi:hypothetical protein
VSTADYRFAACVDLTCQKHSASFFSGICDEIITIPASFYVQLRFIGVMPSYSSSSVAVNTLCIRVYFDEAIRERLSYIDNL